MLDALAHHPDPYPLYAELRARGVHQADDGRWVIPGAAAVAAVLGHPGVRVGLTPPTDPVRALMARFSDGPDHRRRRAIVRKAPRPGGPTGPGVVGNLGLPARADGEAIAVGSSLSRQWLSGADM